jgi:hypothetical protein
MSTALLLTLPTWLLGGLILGSFALYSVLATLVVERFTRTRRKQGHNEVLGFMFSAVAVMYGVLLALVVFAVWDQFSQAERVVDRETADLVSLYFDAESFPAPIQNQAKESIRAYTESVARDEFPAMRSGQPSPVTRARLYDIFSGYLALQPADQWHTALASDSFGRLNDVALLRRQRLSSSQSSLPAIFWALLVPGGLVTLGLGAWLFMEHRLVHLMASLVVGMMLGTTLFLIAVLDRPFAGSVAIQPDPYEQNLQIYVAIDEIAAKAAARPR